MHVFGSLESSPDAEAIGLGEPHVVGEDDIVVNRIARRVLTSVDKGQSCMDVKGGRWGIRKTHHSLTVYGRVVQEIEGRRCLEVKVNKVSRVVTPDKQEISTRVVVGHEICVTTPGKESEQPDSRSSSDIIDQIYPPPEVPSDHFGRVALDSF